LERTPGPLPVVDSIVVRSDHEAHALGNGVEPLVFQKASQIPGCIVRPHVQPDKTVGRMAQCRVREVLVLGEKRDTANPMERWNNVRVLRSEPGNIGPDSPYGDPPMLEQWQLVFWKILVQQVQAAARVGRFPCGR